VGVSPRRLATDSLGHLLSQRHDISIDQEKAPKMMSFHEAEFLGQTCLCLGTLPAPFTYGVAFLQCGLRNLREDFHGAPSVMSLEIREAVSQIGCEVESHTPLSDLQGVSKGVRAA
jgi:hypothetical protein